MGIAILAYGGVLSHKPYCAAHISIDRGIECEAQWQLKDWVGRVCVGCVGVGGGRIARISGAKCVVGIEGGAYSRAGGRRRVVGGWWAAPLYFREIEGGSLRFFEFDIIEFGVIPDTRS